MNPMLDWIYKLVNAIASKKCTAGKAWEPTISEAIKSLKEKPMKKYIITALILSAFAHAGVVRYSANKGYRFVKFSGKKAGHAAKYVAKKAY
jgi:hypothetical protein